jgi:hypothetical protein
MPRSNQAQLNVRSAYARARVQELARLTGMTATQVVEEALRGFAPPPTAREARGLVRRGPILVKPRAAAKITQDQADAALLEVRQGEARDGGDKS